MKLLAVQFSVWAVGVTALVCVASCSGSDNPVAGASGGLGGAAVAVGGSSSSASGHSAVGGSSSGPIVGGSSSSQGGYPAVASGGRASSQGGQACAPECTNSQLCDTTRGLCVACLTHADCPAEQFCSAGTCLSDICTANTARCLSSSVIGRCDSSGSIETTWNCAETTICKASGETTYCQQQICTPGEFQCSGLADTISMALKQHPRPCLQLA